MRIGELSQRTGITHRALRYYEEQGLLRPLRRPSGYREYAEADVHQVLRIRELQGAGLSTATIADVLPCLVRPCRADGDDERAPLCSHLAEVLDEERTRISGAIDELRSTLDTLESVMARPGRLRASERVPPVQPLTGRELSRRRTVAAPPRRLAPDRPSTAKSGW
ncbi:MULTISPECIES: MerR family transcriptional regulator [unclassified Streptomyces]|uniref:MerR family transcriptional regulator n=1 Tax=unclassified Streptomyces TaxID=2593676 RepID=UPI003811A116